MCLECTCGGKGIGAKLEDRRAACINSTCGTCGFGKHWSRGLRRLFVTRVQQAGGRGLASEVVREDIPDILRTTLHWSNYAYRLKENVGQKSGGRAGGQQRAAAGGADEEEEWEEAKKSKELFVQARSGTLLEFLDEFEASLAKHLVHRSTLSRQKAASLACERDRRPGVLFGDIDYAENFDNKEARQVQSEHWGTSQTTLFIGVWQWGDVGAWNLEVGDLKVGAEVTARGEKAGEARAEGSYWARVISKNPRGDGDCEDSYVVENEKGDQNCIRRSLLRHRLFVKQCHTGVTGDKKHDR
jgi:hypothetical protein